MRIQDFKPMPHVMIGFGVTLAMITILAILA